MSNDSVLNALSVALEAKDPSVRTHSHRVGVLAAGLGRQVPSLPQRDRALLHRAATLHDIGKVRVREQVLNKPDCLTVEEFQEMAQHSADGATIAEAAGYGVRVVAAVRAHHERWDGQGYPDKLFGLNIPLMARIIAVVDCYDALTEDRPYRKAMLPATALKIIQSASGTYYDPDIVRLFLRFHAALREEMLDSPPPPSLFELLPAPMEISAPQTGFSGQGDSSNTPGAASV